MLFDGQHDRDNARQLFSVLEVAPLADLDVALPLLPLPIVVAAVLVLLNHLHMNGLWS